MTSPRKLLWSAFEAAAALSISERTLHTRTKAGEVPHVRVGHRVLYPVDVLQEWIAAGCPPVDPPAAADQPPRMTAAGPGKAGC